jgi:hypothetical protein
LFSRKPCSWRAASPNSDLAAPDKRKLVGHPHIGRDPLEELAYEIVMGESGLGAVTVMVWTVPARHLAQ